MLLRMFELLASVCSSVSVVAPLEKYRAFQLPTVADRWPGEGPLGGILTALQQTATEHGPEWNLILSCDMPFLTPEWLAYVTQVAQNSPNAEVVVPLSASGLEPLCGCWKTSAVAKIEESFAAGNRKVSAAIRTLRAEELDESHWKRFDTAGQLFWNMNSAADYEEAVRLWTKPTN